MAIARCDKHTPDGTKHEYRVFALPIGHPETAAICGRAGARRQPAFGLQGRNAWTMSGVLGFLAFEPTQRKFVSLTSSFRAEQGA
jgi:hypothetical protein